MSTYLNLHSMIVFVLNGIIVHVYCSVFFFFRLENLKLEHSLFSLFSSL